MTMYFFRKKVALLKASENQTNYEQLQNTKTIDSKDSQNENTPGCFCNKEKENQKDKQEEDTSEKVNQNMAIVRSLDGSCNSQRTILAGDHKNDEPKGEKNKKCILVIL